MNGAVQGLATSAPLAQAAETAAELVQARQRQRKREQQVDQQGDEPRRLQLEAPADGLAAGTQAQQQRGEHGEGDQHAGGVGRGAGTLRGSG
jgi:hypothetical protein